MKNYFINFHKLYNFLYNQIINILFKLASYYVIPYFQLKNIFIYNFFHKNSLFIKKIQTE